MKQSKSNKRFTNTKFSKRLNEKNENLIIFDEIQDTEQGIETKEEESESDEVDVEVFENEYEEVDLKKGLYSEFSNAAGKIRIDEYLAENGAPKNGLDILSNSYETYVKTFNALSNSVYWADKIIMDFNKSDSRFPLLSSCLYPQKFNFNKISNSEYTTLIGGLKKNIVDVSKKRKILEIFECLNVLDSKQKLDKEADNTSFLLNSGARAVSMSWAPIHSDCLDTSDQYLAVAIRQRLSVNKDIIEHMIQFYNFGPIRSVNLNAGKKTQSNLVPKMSMVLLHDWGENEALEWSPQPLPLNKGCVEKLLGHIAVACASPGACVRIIPVPRTDSKSVIRLSPSQPVLALSLGIKMHTTADTGIVPTTIHWHRRQYDRILVGYNNGYVAMFVLDRAALDILLMLNKFDHLGQKQVIMELRPVVYMPACSNGGSVLSLAVNPLDPNRIVCSSLTEYHLIYLDLSLPSNMQAQPTSPGRQINLRGTTSSLVYWPRPGDYLLVAGGFALQNTEKQKCNLMRILPAHLPPKEPTNIYNKSGGGISEACSLSYNTALNIALVGTEQGSLYYINLNSEELFNIWFKTTSKHSESACAKNEKICPILGVKYFSNAAKGVNYYNQQGTNGQIFSMEWTPSIDDKASDIVNCIKHCRILEIQANPNPSCSMWHAVSLANGLIHVLFLSQFYHPPTMAFGCSNLKKKGLLKNPMLHSSLFQPVDLEKLRVKNINHSRHFSITKNDSEICEISAEIPISTNVSKDIEKNEKKLINDSENAMSPNLSKTNLLNNDVITYDTTIAKANVLTRSMRRSLSNDLDKLNTKSCGTSNNVNDDLFKNNEKGNLIDEKAKKLQDLKEKLSQSFLNTSASVKKIDTGNSRKRYLNVDIDAEEEPLPIYQCEVKKKKQETGPQIVVDLVSEEMTLKNGTVSDDICNTKTTENNNSVDKMSCCTSQLCVVLSPLKFVCRENVQIERESREPFTNNLSKGSTDGDTDIKDMISNKRITKNKVSNNNKQEVIASVSSPKTSENKLNYIQKDQKNKKIIKELQDNFESSDKQINSECSIPKRNRGLRSTLNQKKVQTNFKTKRSKLKLKETVNSCRPDEEMDCVSSVNCKRLNRNLLSSVDGESTRNFDKYDDISPSKRMNLRSSSSLSSAPVDEEMVKERKNKLALEKKPSVDRNDKEIDCVNDKECKRLNKKLLTITDESDDGESIKNLDNRSPSKRMNLRSSSSLSSAPVDEKIVLSDLSKLKERRNKLKLKEKLSVDRNDEEIDYVNDKGCKRLNKKLLTTTDESDNGESIKSFVVEDKDSCKYDDRTTSLQSFSNTKMKQKLFSDELDNKSYACTSTPLNKLDNRIKDKPESQNIEESTYLQPKDNVKKGRLQFEASDSEEQSELSTRQKKIGKITKSMIDTQRSLVTEGQEKKNIGKNTEDVHESNTNNNINIEESSSNEHNEVKKSCEKISKNTVRNSPSQTTKNISDKIMSNNKKKKLTKQAVSNSEDLNKSNTNNDTNFNLSQHIPMNIDESSSSICCNEIDKSNEKISRNTVTSSMRSQTKVSNNDKAKSKNTKVRLNERTVSGKNANKKINESLGFVDSLRAVMQRKREEMLTVQDDDCIPDNNSTQIVEEIDKDVSSPTNKLSIAKDACDYVNNDDDVDLDKIDDIYVVQSPSRKAQLLQRTHAQVVEMTAARDRTEDNLSPELLQSFSSLRKSRSFASLTSSLIEKSVCDARNDMSIETDFK